MWARAKQTKCNYFTTSLNPRGTRSKTLCCFGLQEALDVLPSLDWLLKLVRILISLFFFFFLGISLLPCLTILRLCLFCCKIFSIVKCFRMKMISGKMIFFFLFGCIYGKCSEKYFTVLCKR